MVAASELPITTVRQGTTAQDMAETIFGDGVVIVDASYTGDNRSAGIFRDGSSIAPNATPSDTGVILSTGRADDYTNSSGDANQSTDTTTNTRGPNNEPLFNAAAGVRTRDASFLDVDFVPDQDVMTMQFVFASEEYPEFQTTIYQDFVGVWVNGTQVPLAVGDAGVDPGNINSVSNSNLYVDNAASAVNTEMDGLMLTLSLTIPVEAGSLNSIRIGVADVFDARYDSSLLIAADSLQTDLVAQTDTLSMGANSIGKVEVLNNDINNSGGALTITHINGVPATVGTMVTLKSGQTVSLNPDGSIEIFGDGDVEDFNFTYTVDNGINTDTGIVNVSTIPCFVVGTLIKTPDGECPIETLAVGDLVLTQDDGPQAVRWVGRRKVQGTGPFAPIRIKANTFGQHRQLLVSPEHRILIRDGLAELLFGEPEVLVPAKALVDDLRVRPVPDAQVEYVHIMFDRHQVIFAEGLPTESFLPGPQTTSSFESAIIDEICTIFPEIDPWTGHGYGRAARRTLRRFEADLLQQTRISA